MVHPSTLCSKSCLNISVIVQSLASYDHSKYCREINFHVVFGSMYIIIFLVFISAAFWLLSCFNQCFFLILCIYSLCWNWQHHFFQIFFCYSAQFFFFISHLISLRFSFCHIQSNFSSYLINAFTSSFCCSLISAQLFRSSDRCILIIQCLHNVLSLLSLHVSYDPCQYLNNWN